MTDQAADIRPWWRGRGVWFWFFQLTAIILSIWMLSVLGGNFYNALYPALPEAEARLPGAC